MNIEANMNKDNFGMSYFKTLCPHNKLINSRSNSITRVGSWACHICNHFKNIDINTLVVTCDKNKETS